MLNRRLKDDLAPVGSLTNASVPCRLSSRTSQTPPAPPSPTVFPHSIRPWFYEFFCGLSQTSMSTIRQGNFNVTFCWEEEKGTLDKSLVMRHVFKWGLCGCWIVQTIPDYVRKKKLGSWWWWGVERDNTKAGGRFPRNGKEVVWRASTLEPTHEQTLCLLHDSVASLRTCCPLGKLMSVRSYFGVMILHWLKTPPTVPHFLQPPHCYTLHSLVGIAGLPQLDFIPAHYMRVGNMTACAGSVISRASC